MTHMETVAHQRLKQLALTFLRHWGCHAVATEVRCPISRYRVDVAGYLDRLPAEHGSEPVASSMQSGPRTLLIECKQDRSDFLRDTSDHDQLLQHRDQLARMRRSIEQNRIERDEPELRKTSTSLFDEMSEWDYSQSTSRSYRKVIRAMRRVDMKLHGQTKFCMAARYHLADFMYLLIPKGLIRPRELPPGWGLLECPPDWLESDEPVGLFDGPPLARVRIPAPMHESRHRYRQRLLRNIAVAASYKAFADVPGVWKAAKSDSTVEVKHARRDSNPQPSVPKTDALSN